MKLAGDACKELHIRELLSSRMHLGSSAHVTEDTILIDFVKNYLWRWYTTPGPIGESTYEAIRWLPSDEEVADPTAHPQFQHSPLLLQIVNEALSGPSSYSIFTRAIRSRPICTSC